MRGRTSSTYMVGLPRYGGWRQRLTYGVLGASWHFLSWNRKRTLHHNKRIFHRGKKRTVKRVNVTGWTPFEQARNPYLAFQWIVFDLEGLC